MAASKAPWSSPAGSVLAPAPGPSTIFSEPGTKVVPAGTVSLSRTLSAAPPPWLTAVTR
nr:hypothetical protein [Microbispora sitophila]